jgi:prepilin-type N-terminal cleavage/methylation domain-containing protein
VVGDRRSTPLANGRVIADDDRTQARIWLAVLAALSLVPVAGLFTTHKIFYVRDLSLFFWSRHLWLRHTLLSGAWPLWNPYPSSGLNAAADALNQIWMPVTLAVRLLPSDVVSFNLWVALPLPACVFGTYAFLRRGHTRGAAALGACAFALSGAMVSSLNAPNLSWSVACLPWVAWAADRIAERPEPRRAAVLAAVFGLQALSGEPVTLVASGAVALVPPLARAAARGRRPVLDAYPWIVFALLAGAALSAVQMLPTIAAGVAANRAGRSAAPDFWSLHPLGLIEVVVPHLFGNYYDAFIPETPWMARLNSGREPFFYSIYAGPLVMLLACAALRTRWRAAAPWLALTVIFALAAMGGYTPVYPLVRRLLPPLAFFRFPVKYAVIALFGIAVAAAQGWDALADERARRRIVHLSLWGCAGGVCAGIAVLAAVGASASSLETARALAHAAGVTDANAAAAFLVRTGAPLLARSAGLLLAGGALLFLASSGGRRARAAAWLLFAATIGDLLVSNGGLNPTVDASRMNAPAWYAGLASADRLYVGGRVRGFMDASDRDAGRIWTLPAGGSAIERRMALNAELPLEPSGWRVREAVSYDLPVLLPDVRASVVERFLRSSAAERAAFLRRSGVRWCVQPVTSGADHVLAHVHGWHMLAVECNAAATRVFVTHAADVTPAADAAASLFDPGVPDTVLRVAREPAPAGTAGIAAREGAELVDDGANHVVVNASLATSGYMVLRDSYDPSWRATVDGEPADVVRANGLYRAVRLRAGPHVIRFEYRPRAVMAGLIVSVITAMVLAVFARRGSRPSPEGASTSLPRRSPEGAKAGFTLVELMIVMAILGILLAVAFARYRGMRARANEASAVASLRTIVEAERAFALTCGHHNYATTLPALGRPVPATGQPFLSPDLTSADTIVHSGYVFHMTATPLGDALPSCNGVPVSAGYGVAADPQTPGTSGTRFFAVNADGNVYADTATFTDNLPETGPPGHGVEVNGGR